MLAMIKMMAKELSIGGTCVYVLVCLYVCVCVCVRARELSCVSLW